MEKLTCRLGRLNGSFPVPPWATEAGPNIAEAFARGSNDAIDLRLDATGLAQPIDTTGTAPTSFDLHTALRNLIGNPTDPTRTIGVLFAGRYAANSSMFGLMFDTGFDISGGGTATLLAGPPREGCVVFLDAILSGRQQEGSIAYETQALFTTIHEIGHLFNLAHNEVEQNFLHTSGDLTFPESYWRFTDAHSNRLQMATPTNKQTWPGGSAFDDVGHEDDGSEGNGLRLRRASSLDISVGLARDSFHYYEPIELDIAVRLKPGISRSIRIPNIIDPGYSCFRVWIEDPIGERRLLRSPRRYCWCGDTLSISPGKPFHRDISVFGDARGYTFRRYGAHNVWVELIVEGHPSLVSNIAGFEVRPIRSESERQAQALFTTRSNRVLLYHRLDRFRGAGLRSMLEWWRSNRRNPGAASVAYALARALSEKAPRQRAKQRESSETLMKSLLTQACQSTYLGARQREIGEKLLDR